MSLKISLIAAVASNGVIGKNNQLPWHLPDDFTFFKNKTKAHPVIMGRKNFDSLPKKFKPLPDRTNIVITKNKDFFHENINIVYSLEEALAEAKKIKNNEIFIIGGSQIYTLALQYATHIYLTEIHKEFEGNVYFPKFDKSKWVEIERIRHEQDKNHITSFDFVTYKKK